MALQLSDSSGHPGDRHWFRSTLWRLVDAARGGDSPEAWAAREELCRTYRSPLYSYIRSRGYSREDAEDLVQSFLLKLQQKNFWARPNPQKGKLRNLLLKALCQFLADERDKARARKRTPDAPLVSLNEETGQEQFITNGDQNCSPDEQFDEEWASNIMQKAEAKLRQWCTAKGKSALLACVNLLSNDDKSLSVADAAKQLGMSESAFKTARERLRKRFVKLVREEVARTVSNPAEVDEEIRYLLSVFERRR